jgi:hypothetical protein
MPRRSHKKSRSGCKECKKRHIKCDEHRPKCVNCQTANNSCSFEDDYLSAPQSVARSISTPSQQQVSVPPTPSDSWNTPSEQTPDINLNIDHLELLHHWVTRTCDSFVEDPARKRLYQTNVVREALKYRFLMLEILGVAAMHIASEAEPERAAHYIRRATELQSAAMAGFRTQQLAIDEASSFALLVFSSLVGLHVLADHARTYDLDDDRFLDHFLHTVRLMHGVRLLDDWWSYIRSRPEIGPFIDVEKIEPPYDIPAQVQQLDNLIQGPTLLSADDLETYKTAIDHTQWLFAICKIPQKSYKTVHLLMAWPIRATPAFLRLVEERQPQALVILAYFALAVHFYRESWVVRSTGSRLLEAIEAKLDPYWTRWLEWPRYVVAVHRLDHDAKTAENIALDPQLEHNVT